MKENNEIYSLQDAAKLIGTDKIRLCNFLQLENILHFTDGQFFVNKKELKLNRFINVRVISNDNKEHNDIFMRIGGWKLIKRLAQETLNQYIDKAEKDNDIQSTENDTDIMDFVKEMNSAQTAKAMMS